MKLAVSSSLYDSASSRAHAPQAGAAEKSINRGLPSELAVSSDASTSLIQFTSMVSPLFEIGRLKGAANHYAARKRRFESSTRCDLYELHVERTAEQSHALANIIRD